MTKQKIENNMLIITIFDVRSSEHKNHTGEYNSEKILTSFFTPLVDPIISGITGCFGKICLTRGANTYIDGKRYDIGYRVLSCEDNVDEMLKDPMFRQGIPVLVNSINNAEQYPNREIFIPRSFIDSYGKYYRTVMKIK